MAKKRKSRLGGHHNNLGSKTWRKRLFVGNGEFVKAGTIIMKINKNVKLGKNVYRVKNLIHAKANGIVKISKNKVEVIEDEKI